MEKGSNRRVRCFICKHLVPRSYLDVDCDSESDAFALITLRIANKQGCICSECIQYYAVKLGATFEYQSGKYDDSPNSGQNEKLSDYGFSEDDSQTSISTSENSHTTNNSKENDNIDVDKECIKFWERYTCLEYTLSSLENIIKKTVYGQDSAVRDVLYALYFNQMSNYLEETGEEHFKHKHIMLIGGTGVGKTLLATTIAKKFGVVYSVSNATPITSAGYIGEKVENIIERLLDAAGGDMELAQNGVVILDEIDKKRSANDSSGRDVAGKAVQQELLKLLEPSTIWVTRNKNTIPFNTSNITVIMMGAFVGLDEIIKRRSKPVSMGFSHDNSDDKSSEHLEITQDDLIEYGFIPEFIGRIPIICKLNDLSHSTIVDIIYQKLEQYDKLFKAKKFELYFDPNLINKIADECFDSKTGARDVEVKLDKVLRPALYNIFQSQPDGICEIGENGEISILRRKNRRTNDIEEISCPPVVKYLASEE